MNILLAIDGSPYTKKMLAYLATHEEMLGTAHQYTALTVHAPLPPRARAAVGKTVLNEYYADEATKVLDPVEKFLSRKGVQLQKIAKVGPIGDTIAKVAEAGGYDLIIMGSRGHAALATLVLGSVTTQVLAQCSVPVLIVR